MILNMDKLPVNEQNWGNRDWKQETPSIHGTVEFLMRRMYHKGDFPTFSRHIIEINNKLASLTAINLSSTGELANIILKDFSLTNKLLRVVNSASYGNISGKVATVSKAVFLLGFEKVRMIAAALMIFEHFQNRSEIAELEEALTASYMSGVMAMDIAEEMKLGRREEAFICAMLFHLGKVLVICYFPEEYREIRNRMLTKNLAEDSAVRSVLGISYKELGMAISKSWNFPDKIVQSMMELPPGGIKKPKNEQEVLQHLSNYSNELCDIVIRTREGELMQSLNDLSNRYQYTIPMTSQQVINLFKTATADVDRYSEFVRINQRTNSFMKKLIQLRQEGTGSGMHEKTDMLHHPAGPVSAEARPGMQPRMDNKKQEQDQVIENGIQEITDVMKGAYTFGDVIYVILETMYRGFQLDRVLFAMKDTTHTTMIARFGLGSDIDRIIKIFRFSISASPDIFNIAVAKAKGIVIDDADAPNIIRSLPEWYRRTIAAPSFLVYPIVVKDICIGVIYADRKTKGPMLSETQLNHMEELRKLAVSAMGQKRLENS